MAEAEALQPFRLGVNYWPARTAMAWWSDIDATETARDFDRIASAGFDSVRFFLTWEAFQPSPTAVDSSMLAHLLDVSDLAHASGLEIMPTLFTGHMSGVNLIPPWAMGGNDGDDRFRVVSGGSVKGDGLRNWYEDGEVLTAQALLAAAGAKTLAGHPALWAWDLGNENSNCVKPSTRAAGSEWLRQITSAIRTADPGALITNGLHMEDLEEDRKLGPAETALACDFLTMHGYPIYASWARGPTDEHLLPFLAHITRWLGGNKDVLFSEFGLPTIPLDTGIEGSTGKTEVSPMAVSEADGAAYTDRCLSALNAAGCTGAMLWCYSDYERSIWNDPPLDIAVHERSFGLWRADGSAKPVVDVIKAWSGTTRQSAPDRWQWIDIDPNEFWNEPGAQLRRLYGRYRQACGLSP